MPQQLKRTDEATGIDKARLRGLADPKRKKKKR
jgi:hypothetical protein